MLTAVNGICVLVRNFDTELLHQCQSPEKFPV